LPDDPRATPSALGCASGDGAIVLAINKRSGQVVWRTKAETHPSAKVTGSISGHDNMIRAGRKLGGRLGPGLPEHLCRADRPGLALSVLLGAGSLVAMTSITGKILWKRHTNIGNDPITSSRQS